VSCSIRMVLSTSIFQTPLANSSRYGISCLGRWRRVQDLPHGEAHGVIRNFASLDRKESYPQMNMLELILWVSIIWIIGYSGVLLIS